MGIGNPGEDIGYALPYGHIDVVIPIQLDETWPINSQRRNALIADVQRYASDNGIRYTTVDDKDQILIRAIGKESAVDQYRVDLMTLDVTRYDDLDRTPRPYTFPTRAKPS